MTMPVDQAYVDFVKTNSQDIRDNCGLPRDFNYEDQQEAKSQCREFLSNTIQNSEDYYKTQALLAVLYALAQISDLLFPVNNYAYLPFDCGNNSDRLFF
jgi:hypothetical protein